MQSPLAPIDHSSIKQEGIRYPIGCSNSETEEKKSTQDEDYATSRKRIKRLRQENKTTLYSMNARGCVPFELKSSRANYGMRSVYLYAASQSQLLLDEITELAVDAITGNDSSKCINDIRQLIVNLLYPTCLSKTYQLIYNPSQCLRDNDPCRQQLQQSTFRFLLDSCQTKQNTTISLNSTTCNPLIPLCRSIYQPNVTMPVYANELAQFGLKMYQYSLQKLNSLTNAQSEQGDYQFYCLHLPLCNIDTNASASHILWIKRSSVFSNQQDMIKRRVTPTSFSSTTVFTENGIALISNSGMRNNWTLKMAFISMLVTLLIN